MSRIKIRFPGPQLAFVREAHPHCRFDGLLEVTFEFDRAGNVVDCTATKTIPAPAPRRLRRRKPALPTNPPRPNRRRKIDRNAPERNYAGAGLAMLYAIACKRFNARPQGSATVLQFPPANNGSSAGV